jgi:hypothetical protein
VCGERFTGWLNASQPNPLRSVAKMRGQYTAGEGAALSLPPKGGSPRAAHFMGFWETAGAAAVGVLGGIAVVLVLGLATALALGGTFHRR